MQKILCYFIALSIAQSSFAQGTDTSRIFKKFKVDVSFGYAVPQGAPAGASFSGGALFAVEPKFAALDQLSIGLRIEAAAIVEAYTNSSGYSGKTQGKATVSYLATSDYYFSNKGFRPFLGAGAGIFVVANVDSAAVNNNTNANNIPTSSQFGFMIRAGFEAGHFRLGAEYNIAGNNSNYIGLKLGVCFGGGRKKRAV